MNRPTMEQNKYPEPVEALLIILATFALLIIIAIAYSLIFSPGFSPQEIDKNLRLFFILGGGLFIILPLIYAKIKQFEIKSLFRFKSVPLPVIIISIIAGISLSILSDELDRLISLFLPVPDWLIEQMQPLEVETYWDWLLVLSGAVVIASIAEEGLFRGFLQVALEKKGDVTRAVLLSAISWTLVHMNIYWSIQIFLMGVVMGYFAWRTDSIIPAVILHAMNNLLAVLFLNLHLEKYYAWYLYGHHVSPIILVASAGLLVWSVRRINSIY